jgi:uncharacterized membrane protein YbhN (UPF0104 family)
MPASEEIMQRTRDRLPRLPPWAGRVAQVVVACGLLGLLWTAADGPQAARSLATADLGWLALALVALNLQTLLSALRWRLTASGLGIWIGRWHAVREYYLSQLVNQSLPGGMVGDAGRAVRSRQHAGLRASGLAVVLERLAGQVGMFSALACAFLATGLLPGGFDWPAWLAGPVALLLLGAGLSPVALSLARYLPGAMGRGMQGLWRAIGASLLSRRALPGQIALSLATTVCTLAAFGFCAQAVGLDLPLAAIMALGPLILLTMLIPISISGWGLREGAAAALLPLAGAEPGLALAASVAYGLVFIATVLPGLIFLRGRHPG